MVGDDVHDRADQLYAWMDPGGGLIGQLIGAAVGALTGGRINLASKKPPLIFQWGTQIMRCVMSNVQRHVRALQLIRRARQGQRQLHGGRGVQHLRHAADQPDVGRLARSSTPRRQRQRERADDQHRGVRKSGDCGVVLPKPTTSTIRSGSSQATPCTCPTPTRSSESGDLRCRYSPISPISAANVVADGVGQLDRSAADHRAEVDSAQSSIRACTFRTCSS